MSTNGDSSQEAAHRLPRSVTPRHYTLVLEPDLGSATFTGASRTDVDVHQSVTAVVVNAADLDIDQAVLVRDGNEIPLTVVLDAERERAHLNAPHPIEPGEAELHLHFTGTLNDQLRGFYRSVHTDAAGNKQTLATTQFESTDARRAFPCWDEPDLKATFDVTLVVAKGLTAVSNGPVEQETTLDDGRRRVRFARTMEMSTYLLAFIVGELEATDERMAGDVPIRVVAPPGKLHLSHFALECAEFCLGFFERYYDIPYPGLKVDLIAIPDFAAGAMENLGAITFRENALLVDPEAATQAELERVADVVAHELAHMWFGDLVTMKWWNGIWLNEAFATFMELAAVDAFRPEWERWITQKVASAGALELDALPTTRPIEFPVHAPSDAEGMFDVLTYYKGAAVLRMLEQYLGEDRFRDGVRLYLQRHAYANTETSDLWDALEEASGEPCRQLMDGWIYTGGFPTVAVERGDSPTRVVVRQRPTCLGGTDPEPDREWLVPIILRTHHSSGAQEHRLLLDGPSAVLDVGEPVDAVVANAGGHGFYRVAYADDLLEAAADRIDEMDEIERLSLVSDAWAAVLAGDTSAAQFVELVSRFEAERSHRVWGVITGVDGSATGGMHGLLELVRLLDPEVRPALAKRVNALTAAAAEDLGWEPAEDEPETHSLARGTVLRARGVLGNDADTVERARSVLRNPPPSLHPEVRAAAVKVMAGNATDDDRRWLMEQYKAASTPQDEMRFLLALAESRNAEHGRATAEMCLTDDVRSQNAPLVLRRLLDNLSLEVGDQAWAVVTEHWDELNQRMPRNLIGRMLEGVRGRSTPERLAQVEAFLAEHPVPQAGRTIDQIVDRLRANTALREREAGGLAEHLGG